MTPSTALRTDAHDLWGKTPGRSARCGGCGLRAELYDVDLGFCWKCLVTGDAARAFSAGRGQAERTTQADRVAARSA